MKIVIDARMYGLAHAGIGRYVLNLINELDKQTLENDYFILLREGDFKKLEFKNKKIKKIKADFSHYSFKEQLFLPFLLKKIKPDLCHFPHFNVPLLWFGKYVVTIHDLIKHESRGKKTTTRLQFFYWFKYFFYKLLVFSSIKRAKKIIVPSSFWKKRIAERYSISRENITVTYEGASEFLALKKNLEKSSKVLSKYNLKGDFIIYTGSLYPHKNVERLAQAVSSINKEGKKLFLAIVCSRSVFFDRFEEYLKKEGFEVFVFLLGFVPDKDLAVLYKNAKVFVFPSLLEGFGLPGLEAMALSLPVAASNSSCFPEIYKDAVVYFNPLDVKDIKDKIIKIIDDRVLREELIKKGLKLVSTYSWDKMTKETLQVYKKALA